MPVSVGPSPRGRGSHVAEARHERRVGSIPAWAGEPASFAPSAGAAGVHPRVGGGARSERPRPPPSTGPSPRGRGSRRRLEHEPAGRGSIPAWAGEPASAQAFLESEGVHPRVGGGAESERDEPFPSGGPSPRGRGSPNLCRIHSNHPRSIPAWAGEPRPETRPCREAWVHPRVGGGALPSVLRESAERGPSPRGRGSRLEQTGGTPELGSIPAWAGEPRGAAPRPSRPSVHPRVGGGAPWRCPPSFEAVGPSPRGRGSRRQSRG